LDVKDVFIIVQTLVSNGSLISINFFNSLANDIYI